MRSLLPRHRGLFVPRLSTSCASRLSMSTANAVSSVTSNGSRIHVTFQNGQSTQFHNEYLFDHCRCQKCVHSVTQQRLKAVVDFPSDVYPESVKVEDDGISITWPQEHISHFPLQVLKKASYDPPLQTRDYKRPHLWTSSIAKSPPIVEYSTVIPSLVGDGKAEAGVLKWLDAVAMYGFCFVTGVPASPKATEELIKRIAFIRETHWLQIFHLLSHPRPPGQGGESLLVDGFHAACVLREKKPESYDVLSRLAVPAHASGTKGQLLRPTISQPALCHDEHGQLAQVRWNNEDRGVIGAGWSPEDVAAWYNAARDFEQILRDPENEYWVQLEPGTMVVIDNWRVLHGRAAFTGSRRMCGAYIGSDDWKSRRAALRRSLEGNEDAWQVGW